MIRLRLHDLTLRNRVRRDQGRADAYCLVIAHALDAAGVDTIEVAAGIPGQAVGAATLRWCETVAAGLCKAKLAITLHPDRLAATDAAALRRYGIGIVRVMCEPGAEARRAVEAASRAGVEVDTILPATPCEPAQTAATAACLVRAGAHSVTIADTAGRLQPSEAATLFDALRAACPAGTEFGVEPHSNLSVGVANAMMAIEHGARRICGTLGGMGEGVGAAPLETMVAAAERIGYQPGGCLFDLIDIAEDLARPLMAIATTAPLLDWPSPEDRFPHIAGLH